jgi:hypothetical protein
MEGGKKFILSQKKNYKKEIIKGKITFQFMHYSQGHAWSFLRPLTHHN